MNQYIPLQAWQDDPLCIGLHDYNKSHETGVECISSLTVLKSNFLCIVLGATNSIGET